MKVRRIRERRLTISVSALVRNCGKLLVLQYPSGGKALTPSVDPEGERSTWGERIRRLDHGKIRSFLSNSCASRRVFAVFFFKENGESSQNTRSRPEKNRESARDSGRKKRCRGTTLARGPEKETKSRPERGEVISFAGTHFIQPGYKRLAGLEKRSSLQQR